MADDLDACGSELELLMERPIGIGVYWLLVPALGGDDIDPSIGIDIAMSEPMPCTLRRKLSRFPLDTRFLANKLVIDNLATDVWQEHRLTVFEQVH